MKRGVSGDRIGIFGGTFDPVHIGHLRSALEIANSFQLSKVFLLPAGIPPHKPDRVITPFEHRYAMIRDAIEGAENLGVLDLEGKREGPSYTVDTLTHFRCQGVNAWFIVGSEAFLEIGTWRSYKKLFELSNFIVLLREGASRDAIFVYLNSIGIRVKECEAQGLRFESGMELSFFTPTPLRISGRMLRSIMREGGTIRYLVPDSVLCYIRDHGLYRVG